VHADPPLRRDMTCIGDILAMPYIVSGKVKRYFDENGRGYPIIFLHEFESDSRAWDSQIQHFARNYRCITISIERFPDIGARMISSVAS
jgi:pimeloyl-ACP methyl ester carboxylesterase